ncbi:flavodoxin-dependent (E)-4-hydroxy-3-methylbut-2-enyl-diphosphate synthase [Aminipila butyrica]|uniref:4-hydroxy-3-methylbut-2-en-1-yl diphosphate synthase (flavodoxin) n=1 Tax=Aminipila butyrica TaxID=433296 RepID=A0A858BVF1_9FIRM|nr:flavodoxin-dependent (E)-4-hydroxy-3-methylbut-2-enyl-diphosphate synthase [Aminipila butyrica]QIB69035.1 flavodoxin-dependent (E)-4-hydroxy-3-methylbut-2-enyl-diphosphate synthase [Aminipila butyrica]
MRKSVRCGDVIIGGNAPVSIQSMTNIDTRDIPRVVGQIRQLEEAGCQIIRLAVPDMESADAFGQIKKQVKAPLVADIHFDYRLAVAAIEKGADKVRINPGNIGSRERIQAVVTAAKARNIPIRVGVNSGSLEKDILQKYGGVTAEGLAESALRNAELLEQMDFEDIVLSLKASDVALNYQAHRLIAEKTNYPIHIGITESGTVNSGKLKSAIGIGGLLLAGIGDTMRVSLTGDPVKEVYFARDILKAMGIRPGGINLVSCPTCGRTRLELERIALEVEDAIIPLARKREALGLPPITVAVMGCVVNGPGEAREADFGVAGGDGKGVIFARGQIIKTVPEEAIVSQLLELIDQDMEGHR